MASHVLGIDVSTTATKAILVDEAGEVVGVGSAEYDYDVPRPLWSEQDPQLWWDGGAGRDPRGAGERRHRRRRRRRGRARRPDARRRAARRRRPAAAAGDPLERPANGSRVRRDPRAGRRRRGSSRSPATTPSPGSPRRSCSGSASTSPRSGHASRTSCCRRTSSAIGSPASTRSTGPTAPARSCSTSRPGTGPPEVLSRPSRSIRPGCRGPPRVPR